MTETTRNKMIPAPQLVTVLALVSLVGFVVFATDKLPLMVDGSPGPRFMPLVLAALIAILTVLYAAESYLLGQNAATSMPTKDELKRPALFVAFSILLIVLWERLGAATTVLVVSLLELHFLEEINWRKSLAVAITASVVTWLIFDVVLGVSLPLGILKDILYN